VPVVALCPQLEPPRSSDRRLILRTGQPALLEEDFLCLNAHSLVNDRHQIAQPRREPGIWIPRIHKRPAMVPASDRPGARKPLQLMLDGNKRHAKIPRHGPSVGFAMMKQVQQHGLRSPPTEKLMQR